MDGEYKIYRITSPSGKYYIGLTKMAVSERWRKHRNRAYIEKRNHPFYNAVRKYGHENFIVETIDFAPNKKAAQKLESKYIADAPEEELYNLSPGGEADGETGAKIFWDRINRDPKAKKRYLEKLSNVKLSNDWTDYEQLGKRNREWRKENPKEAWKLTYRGLRLARKVNGTKEVKEEPLKVRLMRKHKWDEYKSAITKRTVTKVWVERSDEEKAAIGAKISASQKKRMREIAVLPDFKQDEWPYAKATCLRKIRQGLTKDEIIKDAIKTVKNKGSHWREVEEKLKVMGVNV